MARKRSEPEAVEPEADAEPEAVDEPEVEGDETAEVPPELADEVGQAIALREQAVAPASSIPLPAEWNALEMMATRLAHSRVVPEAYRGRPDDVIAAWLYGREIGLGQMTALRDIFMVDGRAAIAAHRQLGILRRGGVRILESEATDERAYIVAQRKDTSEIMRVEFTMEEAARIQRKGKRLVDGDNWKSYPKDMLWARCVGRLTRRLGPDLIGGLPPYVAEEIADFSGWGIEYGGGDDALTLHPQARSAQAVPAWKQPPTWKELGERCSRMLGAEEWEVWRGEILRKVYNVERVADISEGLDAAWRCFQIFLRELELWEPEHELDPLPRSIIRKAAAEAFDGIVVDGPEWRLTPDEKDRPVRSPGIPDGMLDGGPYDSPEEQIEDAVVVEDIGAEDPEDVLQRAAQYRQELQDDIDKMLVASDKARKVERGTTYSELVAHYGKPANDVSVTTLQEIDTNLREYTLAGAGTGFDEFCASKQQISFG